MVSFNLLKALVEKHIYSDIMYDNPGRATALPGSLLTTSMILVMMLRLKTLYDSDFSCSTASNN